MNRDSVGKIGSKWCYLMKRGEDCMYDGFVKFNMENDSIDCVVEFGDKRLGGEALFVPKEGAESEDDGYLMVRCCNQSPESSSERLAAEWQ